MRSLALAFAAAALFAAPALHAAPGDPPSSSPAEPPALSPVQQARTGIVQVEQQGRPMAVGIVLDKDGRIVTALSALGTAEQADVRYADGTVVRAKLAHKDASWDLALLVPQAGKWLEGLVPTTADPSVVELRAYLPNHGRLELSPLTYKGRVDAVAKDGTALKSALDLDAKGLPTVPGAPVLDPNGKVTGVFVRACKSSEGDAPKKAPKCTPTTVAAPVYALRAFLIKTPPKAALPAPWLGLGGAPAQGPVKGVKVMGLAPGSPAEKGGLKAGGDKPDVIVAVDGQPVENPDQLAKAIAKFSVGQTVKLLVFGDGRFREVPVTLRAAP